MTPLPCPFCGNTNVIVFDWTVSDNTFDGHKEYAYTCQNCGAEGPNDLSESGALEGWNIRRPQAEFLEALREIAKTEGAFSRDPLVHAQNTIAHMAEIAEQAIAKVVES